jgi:hypothetical protein
MTYGNQETVWRSKRDDVFARTKQNDDTAKIVNRVLAAVLFLGLICSLVVLNIPKIPNWIDTTSYVVAAACFMLLIASVLYEFLTGRLRVQERSSMRHIEATQSERFKQLAGKNNN